ncbi:unnamed protein product [Gongylonema pulchrum]|uniref:Cauli_VI domain-containing protein n=1 Tax=Gongylonema pulchrum TaxID=637853 RepID=A0A183E6D6_9BILA|nr:unnamed protein product [Gongylonema pulchrum]
MATFYLAHFVTFVIIPEMKGFFHRLPGARFKRFRNAEDAKQYAEKGDQFSNSKEPAAGSPSLAEPSVSYPAVSRIMLNRLKKSIEKKVCFKISSTVK